MKSFFNNALIALFGLITTALAVGLNFLSMKYMETELFTTSVWFFIPIGALILGAVSATGYYAGSWLTSTRPNWILLVQMLVIAGAANLAIYVIEYRTEVFDDGTPISAEYSFPDYMHLSLTTAHYTFGNDHKDTGEVGLFGYALALLHFAGFLGGSLGVYTVLKKRLFCLPCQKYLRGQGSIAKNFENENAFKPHYDTLTTTLPNTMAMSQFAATPKLAKRARRGTHQLVAKLYHCPSCRAQTVQYTVQVLGHRSWVRQDDMTKTVTVPTNVDMKPAFAKL